MSPVVRASGGGAKAAKPAGAPGQARPNMDRAPTTPGGRAGGRKRSIPGAKKIVNQELPNFSRQMAAMLGAGVPIVASLDALEEQAVNPNYKFVVHDIKKAIEGGSSFSEALGAFPSVFDDLYVNMVKSGETGGLLAESLARVASFLEASGKLRRKVKSAMTYPIVVLCIALGIATGMIIFIVPIFAGIFKDFGAQLPGPTQFLVNLSNGMRKYGLFALPVFVAFIVALNKWKKTETGSFIMHRFALHAPVFGDLTLKVAMSRFSRTLGQLIRSGVPILSALETVAGATGNKVVGKAILEARVAVERGDPLSVALSSKTCFPSMLLRMMAAGEQTGKVDEMMDNVADFYDSEIETTLASLTSLIEPLLMLFLGVVVGGIVIALFLPIFKLPGVMGGG